MDKCGDNRFEIIEKAKQDLLNSTNIDSSKDEMKVLDNFLFRCWQMGWLKQYNLTSDAEGEEMLMCEKSRVQKIFAGQTEAQKSTPCGTILHHEAAAKAELLYTLFGSKCLPDERNEDSFTTKEPKFKYKEGDKVVRYCDGKVYVVVDYCEDDNINHYIMVDALGNRYSDSEGNLELYEGPKYCVGQEVRHKGQNHEIGEIVKYWGDEDPGRYSVRFGKEYHNISEAMLEPYEEPKSAEPKFKVGDIVRFKYCCTTYRIDGFKMSDGVMLYQVGEVWAEESDLEPYTEPEASTCTETWINDCPSPCPSQDFDNILKDGFSNERRLTIAAMAMQGILTRVDDTPQVVAETAFRYADALLAESEKGGSK